MAGVQTFPQDGVKNRARSQYQEEMVEVTQRVLQERIVVPPVDDTCASDSGPSSGSREEQSTGADSLHHGAECGCQCHSSCRNRGGDSACADRCGADRGHPNDRS